MSDELEASPAAGGTESLQSLIEAAARATKTLRGLVAFSCLVCLVGSLALAIYWKDADLGGLMKLGLAGLVAAGMIAGFLLVFAWNVMRRAADVRSDVGRLDDDLTRFIARPLDGVGPVSGDREALGWLYLNFPRIRSESDEGEKLAPLVTKLAMFGNPLVGLFFYLLSLAGVLIPLVGGVLIFLRFWWRARTGG